MKRLVFLIIITCICVNAFAAKPTSYTDVRNIGGRFLLNYPQRQNMETKYYPMAIQFWCDAITEDGGSKRVSAIKLIGTPKEKPFTNKEIYKLIPNQLKPVLKELVQKAIDEDISQ